MYNADSDLPFDLPCVYVAYMFHLRVGRLSVWESPGDAAICLGVQAEAARTEAAKEAASKAAAAEAAAREAGGKEALGRIVEVLYCGAVSEPPPCPANAHVLGTPANAHALQVPMRLGTKHQTSSQSSLNLARTTLPSGPGHSCGAAGGGSEGFAFASPAELGWFPSSAPVSRGHLAGRPAGQPAELAACSLETALPAPCS